MCGYAPLGYLEGWEPGGEAGDKVVLAVAAERSGLGARFAGSVYIYEILTSSSHP